MQFYHTIWTNHNFLQYAISSHRPFLYLVPCSRLLPILLFFCLLGEAKIYSERSPLFPCAMATLQSRHFLPLLLGIRCATFYKDSTLASLRLLTPHHRRTMTYLVYRIVFKITFLVDNQLSLLRTTQLLGSWFKSRQRTTFPLVPRDLRCLGKAVLPSYRHNINKTNSSFLEDHCISLPRLIYFNCQHL